MRNGLVGNSRDYFKFALLRHLCGMTASDDGPRFRLGVVWYQTKDRRHSGAPKIPEYLVGSRSAWYSALDHELHDTFYRMVTSNRRSISDLQDSGILPGHTKFFVDTVPRTTSYGHQSSPRAGWLQKAFLSTTRTNIVFLDPNCGLRPPSYRYRASNDHALQKELEPFWRRGQSLVVYQHRDRGQATEQLAQHAKAIKEALGCESSSIKTVQFPSHTMMVVAQPAHSAAVEQRLGIFQAKLLDWSERVKRS